VVSKACGWGLPKLHAQLRQQQRATANSHNAPLQKEEAER